MKKAEKNYYFIEGVSNIDLIGFDTYLNSVKTAILNGARFIGLISDYGTGKSTLINMLKKRNMIENSEIISVNLWNCKNNTINNLGNKTVDIHRIFLHQLIDGLNLKNKDYYKKKIDKNYSIFDIKTKLSNKFYLILLLVFYILCFLDNINIIELFDSDFKLFIYIGITIFTVLCIFIYKPIIAYKKADSTQRDIDENDTKDLYSEIIEEYKKQLPKSDKDKKIIICLEELDRYDLVEVIIEYLKEFYKFYKETPFKEDVIFIISIKSAHQLFSLSSNKKENKDIDEIKKIYEKIFDFILNLNPINIHDYDSIVIDLLNSKKYDLPEGIKIPNANNLKNWKYLYKGKNIKIRDIKHRYNFAIALYLSVTESGISADINKCLFIAYLEDENNELYNKLISSNDLLNTILIKYASGNKELDDDDLNEKLTRNEKDLILEGLTSNFISVDYNYYFYKFPKNKKAFTPEEYELYNAIFFDDEHKNINFSIKKLNDRQILNIIKKATINTILPNILFINPRLFLISQENLTKEFEKTVEEKFDIINNFEGFKFFINCSKKLKGKNYLNIINCYFKKNINKINNLNMELKFELRKKIVSLLGNDSLIIKPLFDGENLLISDVEIKKISKLSVLYQLINFNKIDESCLCNLIDYINGNIKKNNTSIIIKILENIYNNDNISDAVYEKSFLKIDFHNYIFSENQYKKVFNFSRKRMKLDIPNNLYKFINHINYYCESFDSQYLDILSNNNDVTDYKNIIVKFQKIYYNGMKFLNDHSDVFKFNKDIREKFYNNGFYNYYIVSTKMDENIYEIEDDKFNKLSHQYIEHFENEKEWNCDIGEKMKEFLYLNVRFDILDISQLSVFNTMLQTVSLIDAVANTKDKQFINNYLNKISKIKQEDLYEVFKIFGNLNNEKLLNSRVKKKLKTFTKRKRYLQLLDARRKNEDLQTT